MGGHNKFYWPLWKNQMLRPSPINTDKRQFLEL